MDDDVSGFFFYSFADRRNLHSFPTRRSSDLEDRRCRLGIHPLHGLGSDQRQPAAGLERSPPSDRKSTRLNSSHSQISYAVFCLKKKIPDHLIYLELIITDPPHQSPRHQEGL